MAFRYSVWGAWGCFKALLIFPVVLWMAAGMECIAAENDLMEMYVEMLGESAGQLSDEPVPGYPASDGSAAGEVTPDGLRSDNPAADGLLTDDLLTDDPDPWETGPGEAVPGLFDTGDSLPGPQGILHKGRGYGLMDNAVFELGYEASHGVDGAAGLVTHYGWLGLETETLAADRYFIRFDGKLELMPASDHRVRAKEKNFLVKESLREFYLQRSFDTFSLSLGRRVVVWGKTDTAAITDVVSPRDLSRFVFVELEDARKGQFMATATLYHELFTTFLFVSPDPAVNTLPAAGTQYDRPFPGQQAAYLHPHDPGWGDVEMGLRCYNTFSRLDLALMAGRFYANTPVFKSWMTPFGNNLELERRYPRFYMLGAAASLVRENVLLKYELAVKKDFPLQQVHVSDTGGEAAIARVDLLDHALGLEYNANDRWLLTMELTHRHLFGHWDGSGGLEQDRAALYTVFEKKFRHDTLTLEYGFYLSLDDQGRYHDIKATWQVTDQVELKGDITVFSARDREAGLWPYRHEDCVTLEIRYHFSI